MILTMEAWDGRVVVWRAENGKRLARVETAADGAAGAISSAMKDIDPRAAEGVVLAAAAPEPTEALRAAAEQHTGRAPLVFAPGDRCGPEFEMAAPAEADAVLAAAALGARGRYRLPCALIRLGTETAVCALDDRGRYLGELRCPGIPRGAALAEPARLLGGTRRESEENGLVYGMAAMLDGLITRVETETRQQATAVLFGPGAREILPHCHRNQNAIVDDEIVMRGLWRIWRENSGEQNN